MVIACWSAKGGSGTTVVAAALALHLARRHPAGALLCDLAGDAPACLGIPEPEGLGVSDWLVAGHAAPADGLGRLAVPVTDRLTLLPRGAGELAVEGGELLAGVLAAHPVPVVVDCGTATAPAQRAVATGATRSVLVTRTCYLALRRALRATHRPSEVVVLVEPGRALDRRDVEQVLGVPVRAEIPVDPAVARAVDAGLLAGRVPRALDRAVGRAA